MSTRSRPPVPSRLLASVQAPLVGRRAELSTFEGVWRAVESGGRQAVFVGGEPGAGKSRLVAEVATILAEHDVTVLFGTCAVDHGPPYQPFVEALEHLFDAVDTSVRDQLVADSGPELARLSPRLAPRRDEDPDGHPPREVRRVLFDAAAGLFRRLAGDRPLVLVVDDLQWARTPTLALLAHVVTAIEDVPLLVLGAFRTTAPDRSDDLTHTIADLYRLEGVRRMDLSGLDTEDIAAYLVRAGGAAAGDARGAAPVLRDLTGGNPFFLRELWRDLHGRGGLDALRSGQVRAPGSVGDTLERRLMGLGAAMREVIELAAVVGDRFDVATLASAGGTDPTSVLAAIDAGEAIGLVDRSPDQSGAYAFVHALSRQAVIDRLSPSRLTHLHLQVARALRERDSDPRVVPRLAHHYLRCHILGHDREAIQYARDAARLAESSLAFEEAATWLERAADVPAAGGGPRTDLLLAAASNHLRSGGFARAREIYEQLATSDDPRTRLTAAIGHEDASWRPGLTGTRAADLLTAALDGGTWSADDPEYITALAALGRALAFSGQPEHARRVGVRAVALAREHGDEDVLARAIVATLWHSLAPDDAEEQLARARDASERARAIGDHDLLAAAAYFHCRTSYILGRPDELEESARELAWAMQASGQQPLFAYVAGCVQQGRSFLRGDLATARGQAEALAEVGQAFGSDDTEGSFGLQMFMVERETGGLDALSHLFSGNESVHGHWAAGLLALYTELGLRDGMERILRTVLGAVTDVQRSGSQWPAELAFATDAALTLGDTAALERLRPEVERYRGMNLVTGEFVASFGAADRYLARIASHLGAVGDAEALFRSALEMDERMGAAVHVSETLLHHGLHLRRIGDPARARPLLDRARALAQQIGQRRVLRRLPDEATDAPAGLSSREVEVLRLLAEGLSNREIGERLFISGNTAANHVRSILMKTGAANRTQAAIYATEHDLA